MGMHQTDTEYVKFLFLSLESSLYHFKIFYLIFKLFTYFIKIFLFLLLLLLYQNVPNFNNAAKIESILEGKYRTKQCLMY